MKKDRNAFSIFIIVSSIIFLFEIIVMQFVYTQFDPFKAPLSFYATGPCWYVIASGLLCIAADYVLLSHLFIRTFGSNKIVAAGSVILFFIGFNTFTLSIFQTDLGSASSLRGMIHVVSAHLHFAFIPIAAFLLGTGMPSGKLKGYKQTTIGFSIITFAGGVALVMKNAVPFIYDNSGLFQKILIAIIVLWIAYSGRLFWDRKRYEH
jgi:hypothetical protein